MVLVTKMAAEVLPSERVIAFHIINIINIFPFDIPSSRHSSTHGSL
jgi:hypothetical protein